MNSIVLRASALLALAFALPALAAKQEVVIGIGTQNTTTNTATGGVVFYPKDLSEINGLVLQIASDIRSQYTLAYTPPGPDDGSYRQIKVEVDAAGRPVVRTRSGYYARAVSPPSSTSSSSGAVE